MQPFYVPIVELLMNYTFYYPLFMAFVWMAGALHYYFRWEAKHTVENLPVPTDGWPPVSILIPCFNEEKIISETIDFLSRIDYPNFEVIAINDGSTDNTKGVLNKLSQKYDWLRIIHLRHNSGKAMAMRAGTIASSTEVLICIDGDALLEADALYWLAHHFARNPRVGAVTGNPRIRNRSELLGRIQVGEFSSIIGLIKRAERIYGHIFTVGGVCTAFRRTALHDVGYWRPDMLTEDVDITWRLQLRRWQILYEPAALVWILMPDTFKGLWKQRLRWARGGGEVLLRYIRPVFKWESKRLWLIYMNYILGIGWAYSMLLTLLYWGVSSLLAFDDTLVPVNPFPNWSGLALTITFLLQTSIAMFIDFRYDKRIFHDFFWMVWYPFAFWILTGTTAIVGFWQALSMDRLKRAIWDSPDRGGEEK